MTRPTAQIEISIDESIAEKALIEELSRSYPHVAPVQVSFHPTPAAPIPAENIFSLRVKFNAPFWLSEEDGDAGWDTLIPWLKAKLYKVESAIHAYNETEHGSEPRQIQYGCLELRLNGLPIAIKLAEDSSFPDIPALLERLRALRNVGVLKGAELTGVEMPRIDSASLATETPEDARQAIDYAIWRIAEADGSARELDSVGGTWL